MSTFRRGVLYWADLDKRRPVLIVSSDRFNLRSSYVTVVPGSTRLRPLVTHVRLAANDGGLTRPTMLLCEHVQELHQADIGSDPIGPPLAARRMAEVESALRLYLDLEDSEDTAAD
ncbi:MAG TPA: type II toxin-antitoxin system PemK/MazF family toxin [Polyangiaceae bacterium]|jgi:mRNA-degrading endonuclease toxin of MazEF toxin-antitoxin module